jgi:MFS superfamily sulfate permease-like transporter
LTAIILTAITDFGAFDIFLTAVFLRDLFNLFGLLGSISNYFPTNVIEGMLAGIGVIIILKQSCMLFMMLILKEISLLFKVMVAIPSPHYLRF